MSSTNRGSDRNLNDYYVTPIPAILHFLKEFEKDRERMALVYPGGELTVLDPCAGGSSNQPASYPEAIKQFAPWKGCHIDTIDIREDSPAEYHRDYLQCHPDYQPWVIISNPPFSLAMDFITKALKDVHPGGLVIMLLRLNFFGSKKRFQWWEKHMPVLAYVHSERMSFTSDGKTDSIEYMHCVWKHGINPEFVKVRVI